MFVATGTELNGINRKVVLRVKKDMMMFEWSDGSAQFFSGPHLANIRLEFDKEGNSEKLHMNTGLGCGKFPIGTFASLLIEAYGFEYEKLVPDTNITVSAFEKMQKEAADMKKEIERLKTTPVKPIVKAKAKAKIPTSTNTQEVDLLNVV
jgi:hypothetical protein